MFNKIRLMAVVTGLFLLAAGTLIAQTPRELRPGIWVSGSLREGEEQWFSVRSGGNGFITVETTGDTDTYLEAYDSSRNLIAENDDANDDDYNAWLEILAAPGASYLFKLRGFDEEQSGPYQIRASFDPLPPDTERNTERSRAVTIKLGEPVSVVFRSSTESRWYRYDSLRSGTVFTIQSRGNLDTILKLYDAKGEMIEEDDDSGEGMNARISTRVNSGTVIIEVKDYDGKIGRCTLHAEIR